VLRIQDLLILANPGETFITFADQIGQLLPGWKVWFTGYTNDYVGYIPTADRYDLQSPEGGFPFEVSAAHPNERFSYPAYFVPIITGDFRFTEDVGDILVQDLVRFANDLLSTGKP